MAELTDQDRGHLGWMIRCNDEHEVGFLGPTVRKFGQLREMKHLVDAGFAAVSLDSQADKAGYWITAAGRTAFQSCHGNPTE